LEKHCPVPAPLPYKTTAPSRFGRKLLPQMKLRHILQAVLTRLCSTPIPLFVGLISMFVGSTLPDDIANSTRQLLLKGHNILGMVPEEPGKIMV